MPDIVIIGKGGKVVAEICCVDMAIINKAYIDGQPDGTYLDIHDRGHHQIVIVRAPYRIVMDDGGHYKKLGVKDADAG